MYILVLVVSVYTVHTVYIIYIILNYCIPLCALIVCTHCHCNVPIIPEQSPVNSRRVDDDRVLLIVASIGCNSYNGIDTCGNRQWRGRSRNTRSRNEWENKGRKKKRRRRRRRRMTHQLVVLESGDTPWTEW